MKNKRNFIIILIITIITIVVFSLFLSKYLKMSKIEYDVKAGSVVLDANKNYISVLDDSKIKVKWNGNYYLVYGNKNINLGNSSISYNELTGEITLYGTVYKITEDGKVITYNNETVIPNSTDTSFYKLADRKYLLIDRVISNNDRTLETNNFLLVELDIQGNAKLSNNKINVKTLKEMTIFTSKYSFDVSNEMLSFGEYNVDLKKIIGTTNVHKKEEEPEVVDITPGNGGQGGTGTTNNDTQEVTKDNNAGDEELNNNATPNPVNPDGIVNNIDNPTDNGGSGEVIDDLKKKTKLTSVVSIRESITSMDIDYVVYDPYDEYKSVYLEIQKGSNLEIIYLNKSNETLTIKDLIPDTNYHLKFYYTYVNENNELEKEIFSENDAKTLKPNYDISIYKISRNNDITYKVTMQDGFPINMMSVNLRFIYYDNNGAAQKFSQNYEEPVTGSPSYVLSVIKIPEGYNISSDSLIYLTLNSVSYGDKTIEIGNVYTFSMGG